MLGAALHGGGDALGLELCLQPRAKMLHIGFAPDPLLVQQPGDIFVGVRLQKTKRQVFKFPLDFPNAQAVGQRRKHLQRLARQAGRHRQLGGGVVAQGLQARCQAQHDHPQVA